MTEEPGYPIRPTRKGPVPGPESPLWFPKTNRGDDEEIKRKPPHVEGHQLGGRGMATVEELIGLINEANIKAQEAIGTLASCRSEMDAAYGALSEARNSFANALGAVVQARDLVAGAMGSSNSATLTEMLGILQKTIDDHLLTHELDHAMTDIQVTGHNGDEASNLCAFAMEKGEQFIGNALS